MNKLFTSVVALVLLSVSSAFATDEVLTPATAAPTADAAVEASASTTHETTIKKHVVKKHVVKKRHPKGDASAH